MTKTFAITMTLVVAAFSTLLVRAEDPPATFAEVHIDNLEVTNIDTEAIDIRVFVSQQAKRPVTLRKLLLQNVTIEDVRVTVQPVPGPIPLRANEMSPLPSPIAARISYRELESLEPIRRAIANGNAKVRATVRAELQLSLFQQIALVSGGAWVVSDIEQTVPVTTPGGTFGRWTAMAGLTAAEPLWMAGRAASEWRRNLDDLGEDVRRVAGGLLVVLETRYNLRSRNGEIAPVRFTCVGFLADHDRVLAPAEVVEPWLYDGAVAEAIDKGDAQVDRNSVEILATLVRDPSQTLSSKKNEVRAQSLSGGKEHAISVATKRRYRVRFRNNDANTVLLRMQGWKQNEPPQFTELTAEDWQPAAVMRLYGAGSKPSLWLTEARIKSGRIELKDPADASAFGSPVWTKSGIAGMLQDESSGVAAAGLSKKLR